MTDRDVLSFPSPDEHDVEIASRVAALYAATPAADAAQVERCTRNVLAQAMHAPARSRFGVPRARWWWGAAAAAVLVATVARPWRAISVGGGIDSTSTLVALLQGSVTDNGDAVRFNLRLPTRASAVALVGDFNDWSSTATPMAHQSQDGSWSASVPLVPGRHVYAFIVDGKRWLVDPMAPQVPDEGLGPANAVVIEGLPK